MGVRGLVAASVVGKAIVVNGGSPASAREHQYLMICKIVFSNMSKVQPPRLKNIDIYSFEMVLNLIYFDNNGSCPISYVGLQLHNFKPTSTPTNEILIELEWYKILYTELPSHCSLGAPVFQQSVLPIGITILRLRFHHISIDFSKHCHCRFSLCNALGISHSIPLRLGRLITYRHSQ